MVQWFSGSGFDAAPEQAPTYAGKPVVVVAVTGMQREARIVAGDGVRAITCGGRADALRQQLSRTLDNSICGIISFGICGALSPELRPGDCIVPSHVIAGDRRIPADPEWTKRLRRLLPHAVAGAIAGSDTLLRTVAQKAAFFANTGALAADMESHIAAETAQRRGIPFAGLRCVADVAVHDLPHAAVVGLTEDGRVAIGAVIRSVAARPYQLLALMRAGRDSRTAFDGLFRCRNVLGSRLAGPNFRKPALDVS